MFSKRYNMDMIQPCFKCGNSEIELVNDGEGFICKCNKCGLFKKVLLSEVISDDAASSRAIGLWNEANSQK
jgi:hypothetical protein